MALLLQFSQIRPDPPPAIDVFMDLTFSYCIIIKASSPVFLFKRCPSVVPFPVFFSHDPSELGVRVIKGALFTEGLCFLCTAFFDGSFLAKPMNSSKNYPNPIPSRAPHYGRYWVNKHGYPPQLGSVTDFAHAPHLPNNLNPGPSIADACNLSRHPTCASLFPSTSL